MKTLPLLLAGFLGLTASTVHRGAAPLFPDPVTQVAEEPLGMAVADLDADGHQDLIVTGEDAFSATILLGNGDGTFRSSEVPLPDWSHRQIAVADFDEDGHADLMVGAWQSLSGSAAILLVGNGLPDSGYGVCQADQDPDPTDNAFVDPQIPAPPGAGFYYLMSIVDFESERDLGTTSAGLPRTAALPCP